MAKVDVDPAANRLHITLDGQLDEEAVEEVVAQVRDGVDRLSPGFTVVNDLRGFTPLSRTAVRRVAEAKMYVEEHGAATVVRVVGDSVVGRMQATRAGDVSYEAHTVESLEEAERLLG